MHLNNITVAGMLFPYRDHHHHAYVFYERNVYHSFHKN